MKMLKTHIPETRKDTGPAIPRTRCGRELHTVGLVSVGEWHVATCQVCAKE